VGYRASIMMDGGVVAIGEDGKVEITLTRPITSDEMAVIATIGQMLARLSNGKLVAFDFDPKSFENCRELVRCEWLRRTGNLKIHGVTEKPRRFCETVEACLKENRMFTCLRSTALMLPKFRIVTQNSTLTESDGG